MEKKREQHIRGKVTEDDAVSIVIGALNTNDDTARFEVQEETPGTYGSFSIDEYGVWNYRLDNTKPNVQALKDGQKVYDRFVVTLGNVYGKRVTSDVTIEIHGKDEAPEPVSHPFVIHDDTTHGVVTEDEVAIAVGKLFTNVSDAVFEVQTGIEGEYGKFSITRDGYWTYELENNRDVTQALNDDDKRLELFRVSARDTEGRVAENKVKVLVLGKDEKVPAEEQVLRII